MASPESSSYIVEIFTAVGAFIGGIILTLLGVRTRNGAVEVATQYDLSETRRQIEESSRKDRHDIYSKMEQHYAGIGLDIHRIEDNFSEYVKSVDARLRSVERELDRQSRPG